MCSQSTGSEPSSAVENRIGRFPSGSLAPNPEEVVLENDNGTLLRKALEKLPHDLHDVLILRQLNGMSYNEIANITGTPVGTVTSSLSRGRDRLRQALAGLLKGTAVANKRGTTKAAIHWNR
jgi:RNA polymerase sigma factor (sigma-70 family)